MQQRCIEFQRRHRQPFFFIVRAIDQFDVWVEVDNVGAQTNTRRDVRTTPRRRAQAQQHHALVNFHHLNLAILTSLAEIGLQRNKVQRHEGEHHFFHLTGSTQHADICTAIGHDRQVFKIRLENLANQRHWLTTRPPAANTDGHAIA